MNQPKQGKTKRQHYVPQMILKNFTGDLLNTSLVVLSTGKRVDMAPIDRQCYEPYFYGKDQILEESFSARESSVAALLGDLSPSRLDRLSAKALDELRIFVHYQHARTRGAAEALSNFAAAFLKSAMRGTAKLNRVDASTAELTEATRVRLTNAQNESIWHAAKSTPMTSDLAVKFLVSNQGNGFAIADHPVIRYNQFAEHQPVLRRWPSSTGLAVKGLQLFMPLSPSVTLAMYDPSTYAYGGKSLVGGVGPSDVIALNRMQAVNAWECMFYRTGSISDDQLLGLLTTRRSHPSIYDMPVAESDMVHRSATQVSQFTVVNYVDVRVAAKLSFVRILDGHSYATHQGPTIPLRSPKLIELSRLYGQRLEEYVDRARAEQNSEQK